ncbi:Hypothetical predicted protein, partial [Pelobates cultripes]
MAEGIAIVTERIELNYGKGLPELNRTGSHALCWTMCGTCSAGDLCCFFIADFRITRVGFILGDEDHLTKGLEQTSQ